MVGSAIASAPKATGGPAAPTPALEAYRWLLEELRVSLFAQELQTPFAGVVQAARAGLGRTRPLSGRFRVGMPRASC